MTLEGALHRMCERRDEVRCMGPGENVLHEPCPQGESVDASLTRRCVACIQERRRRRAPAPDVAVVFDGRNGQSLLGERDGGSSLGTAK